MGAAPGTAGRQAAQGVSLQQEINVEGGRPVTGVANSMQGMRTGGGRLVHDRSYYLGLFRTKVGEITTEINKNKSEMDGLNKSISQGSQLEKKMELLLREVREREGSLADYNLALDKHRSGTRPEDMERYENQLNDQNEKLSRDVDNVFQRRSECEAATESMQKQIDEEKRRTAARMGEIVNELGPQKGQLYQQLLAENERLEPQLNSLYGQFEEVSAELAGAEAHIASDGKVKASQTLMKSIARMRSDKESLVDDARMASMSPEEARGAMLNKVKQDKKKLEEVTRRLDVTEQENMKHKKTLQLIDADLQERKGAGADTQKYEVLFERDKEMSGFIEGYPATRDKENGAQQATQKTIVELLKHISEGYARSNGQMPSRENVQAMREDLSFKQRQLDSADSTKTRLEAELKKRAAELAKIENLDEKIERELVSLKGKMEGMGEEMRQFSEVKSLRTDAERTREHLMQLKRGYNKRRDNMKTQVQQLSTAYERKKSALAENEHATAMSNLEAKMRHYEQNIYGLREYIATKEHETHYQAVKDECNAMLQGLNDKVIQLYRNNGVMSSNLQGGAMGAGMQ